jgi:hypothetical protein
MGRWGDRGIRREKSHDINTKPPYVYLDPVKEKAA